MYSVTDGINVTSSGDALAVLAHYPPVAMRHTTSGHGKGSPTQQLSACIRTRNMLQGRGDDAVVPSRFARHISIEAVIALATC